MATTPNCFILHGEDGLRQGKQVQRFRQRMGEAETASLNIHEFDTETGNVAEILAAATSLPFLAKRRLVIVHGWLQKLMRSGFKKEREQLLAALPHLPPYTRLVFVEKGDLPKKNPFLLFAQKSDTAHIQHYPIAKDIVAWLRRQALNEYGTEIEPQAARALASVVGKDLRRADSELCKLFSYTDGKRAINESDVEKLTPYVTPANILHLVDAIASGQGQSALRQLRELLVAKERDAFMLLGMIIRQFRLLLLAKERLAMGSEDLARELSLHPFVVQKLRQQVQRFSLAQLKSIHRHLHERDFAIKTGVLASELALELLVGELTLFGKAD